MRSLGKVSMAFVPVCRKALVLSIAVSLALSREFFYTVAMKAARLFDGKSRSLIPNGVVVVQGDKIVDVGSNVAIPNDAKVIDLGDAPLSPGFLDAPTHLTR